MYLYLGLLAIAIVMIIINLIVYFKKCSCERYLVLPEALPNDLQYIHTV